MKEDVLKALGDKAMKLPLGRNELAPRPLAAVLAEAILSPENAIQVYNFRDGTITTFQQVDGRAMAEAKTFEELKQALCRTLVECGLVRLSP